MNQRFIHIMMLVLLCSGAVWGQRIQTTQKTEGGGGVLGGFMSGSSTSSQDRYAKGNGQSNGHGHGHEEETYTPRDSAERVQDSIRWSQVRTKKDFVAPVHYQANDSMVMTQGGNAFLHGKGELRYQSMDLTSDYIRMNLDSSQIYARGVYDSLNYEWTGKPVFDDGKDKYETNEITYNIKTQKGYIRHAVTAQGEGYVIADKTKKLSNNEMMMAGGQYTTCDDHEHPHF